MKKTFTAIVAIGVMLFLGAVGSRIAQREVFPRLGQTSFFSQYDFFKDAAKNTTVIEKTEQIVVREDDSINAVSSQASTSVVRVISRVNATRTQAVTATEGVGVIMTSDGIIATHVSGINTEKGVVHLVLLNDGALHGATLLGVDAFSDVAFLRIDTDNLTSIALANSHDARAGQKLIAIGVASQHNQNRYASGLLSHVDKVRSLNGASLSSSEKYDGFFDVDFNTLDEYRGAPVIDFNGEMVGIVGVFTPSLTAQQKTLAEDGEEHEKSILIPSNAVRDALTRVVRENDIVRTPLGITYRTITTSYAAIHETPRDHGAIIVTPGARGLRAGLLAGDIVTSVNEQEINLDHALSNTLTSLTSTEKIKFSILRADKELEILY